jgi:hypothetical protein
VRSSPASGEGRSASDAHRAHACLQRRRAHRLLGEPEDLVALLAGEPGERTALDGDLQGRRAGRQRGAQLLEGGGKVVVRVRQQRQAARQAPDHALDRRDLVAHPLHDAAVGVAVVRELVGQQRRALADRVEAG